MCAWTMFAQTSDLECMPGAVSWFLRVKSVKRRYRSRGKKIKLLCLFAVGCNPRHSLVRVHSFVHAISPANSMQ